MRCRSVLKFCIRRPREVAACDILRMLTAAHADDVLFLRPNGQVRFLKPGEQPAPGAQAMQVRKRAVSGNGSNGPTTHLIVQRYVPAFPSRLFRRLAVVCFSVLYHPRPSKGCIALLSLVAGLRANVAAPVPSRYPKPAQVLSGPLIFPPTRKVVVQPGPGGVSCVISCMLALQVSFHPACLPSTRCVFPSFFGITHLNATSDQYAQPCDA